jgi:hypothetical protein
VPVAVAVEYIDDHRDRVVEGYKLGVEPIWEVLPNASVRIPLINYYAARTRPPSARAARDAELVEEIKRVHTDNLGVYGARKVWAELNREGIDVARCTVAQAPNQLWVADLVRHEALLDRVELEDLHLPLSQQRRLRAA